MAIDSFLLGERIGRGGMGEVWAARDLRLGRRVALKVVRAGRSGDRGAVARFLDEARITARLSHPNIVTAFAAGEWGGQPWVALEFLDGDTLRNRLRAGPPGFAEAVRLAHDIARAVEAAHAAGIVHGDLKPENVMLPSDGRLRVVDFGLARLFGDLEAEGPEIAPNAGTPAYLAPEQWLGQPPTPASDVWSLGVILWELFSGVRPYLREEASVPVLRATVGSPDPAPSLPNAGSLPDEIVRLVHGALAKDPSERPTAGDLAGRLARRLHGAIHRGDDTSPFRGLLPYGEDDAAWFFGRDREIAAYVERLREVAILPVLGASGAGKSSFVLAGVVPRLREQGACVVLSLRPGPSPMRALAAALTDASLATWRTVPASVAQRLATAGVTLWQLSGLESTDLPSELDVGRLANPEVRPDLQAVAAELEASPGALGVALRALSERGPRVILVVDQLEEVFTQGAAPAQRDAFLRAVFSAADNPGDSVRVLCTLRDDFLGRLAEHLPSERAPRQVFVLHAPDANTLVRVLEDATAAAGARTDDPALYRDLVAEVADSPAALPLVQFAARQLWDRRDRDRQLVRRADWVTMGGGAGALSRHADEVLQGLSPEGLRVARLLLLQLVTADGTRRTLDLDEAWRLVGDAADARLVIERLTGSRLLAVHRVGSSATVELAHDSLVGTWGQLARWLDEARESVRFSQELDEAARLWDRRGRPSDALWRGPALRDAELRAQGASIAPVSRDFLADCRRSEAAYLQRRARLRRFGVVGAVLVTLVSAMAAVAYRRQAAAADLAAEGAVEAEARALAEGAWSAWQRGDGRVARAQLRAAVERGAPEEARDLWWQLKSDPVLIAIHAPSGAYQVDLSADGERAAFAGGDGIARILDVRSGEIRSKDIGAGALDAVTFSADGRKALCVWAGEGHWWDLETDAVTPAAGGPYDGALLSVERAGPDLVGIALAPDETATLLVWRADGRHERYPAPAWHIRGAFSPDGTTAYTLPIRGGQILKWDVATGASTPFAEVSSDLLAAEIALSPSGDQLAIVGNRLQIWDTATGALVSERSGLPVSARVLAFTAAGLGAISSDGDVWVWGDRAGAGEGGRVYTQLSKVRADVWREGYFARATEDGRRMAFANEAGLYVIDMTARGAGAYRGHNDYVSDIAISPDGRAFSSSADARVLAWPADGGAPEGPYATHAEVINRIALSPDGQLLAAASNDDTASLWWTRRIGPPIARIGHDNDVTATAITDTRWWTGDINGAVRAWGLPRPYDETFPLRERPLTAVTSFATRDVMLDFAVGPSAIALALESGDVEVRDLGGGSPRRSSGHKAQVASVTWLPDGGLASSGYDSALLVHHPDGRVETVDDRSVETTLITAFDNGDLAWASRDGLRLGGAAASEVVWPWSVSAHERSPDGRTLWFGDIHGTVRAMDLETRAVRGSVAWFDGEVPVRGDPGAKTAFQRALVGAAVAVGDGRPSACVVTWRHGLARWDVAADREIWSIPGPVSDVVAGPDGRCWWRQEGRVFHAADGAPVEVPGAWESLVGHRDGVALASATEVRAWVGEAVVTLPPVEELSAVVRYPDGSWLLFSQDARMVRADAAGRPTPMPTLVGLRGAAVVGAEAGPGNTTIVGFVSGEYGVWSNRSGRRIVDRRLRGSVRQVRVDGDRVVVGSDLGDVHSFDLPGVGADACGWRDEILRQVPITWLDGQILLAQVGAPRGCTPDAAR